MPHGRGRSGVPAGRRAVLARALVVGVLLVLAPRTAADRRDQKAAELYLDGVELIKKAKYREGMQKINAALERGATEPNEQQGSESRYLAHRYDPYYWLGRAQMALGLFEQALANFEKSETIIPATGKVPVITRWPEEYADLKKRKAELL